MQVDLFIPCYIDQFYPETGMNMVYVLEKLGCKVHYNTEQTCCGQAAFNAGYWNYAKEVGEKFIREFPNDRQVVCPSGSCAGMVKNSYNKLFHNTVLHNPCKQLQKNLHEFTQFVVNILKKETFEASFAARVTYLDACGALRECSISDEPRKIMAAINGLELVELNDTETCCGFGGIFSVKNEALSVELGLLKIRQAIDTGAEYIVSTDMACLMHLESIISKNALPIKTLHIVDLLAAAFKHHDQKNPHLS